MPVSAIMQQITETMNILHTSDWHLGRPLYDKKRYDEFESFLDWLAAFIGRECVDVLLVAGDVFDNTTPSNRAQQLYYQFFKKVTVTACRHVIITGGNHDSPSFLDAPREILSILNIHVVAAKTENPEDEVIVLKSRNGETEAIVCAVPFLRDRDIRTAEAGESPDDKARILARNIAAHYSEVAAIAGNIRGERNIPVIGMGHLFTREGKTRDGDGVRELYIGTIAHVDGRDISEGFDYMALGHLHTAQCVDGAAHVRYCGSPIPMGFGEAGQDKKVVLLRFEGRIPAVEEHSVPCFRALKRLSGSLDNVCGELLQLKSDGSEAWLEVEITEAVPAALITARFDEITAGSGLEIIRIRNRQVIDRALHAADDSETLSMLDDKEVFLRCLEAHEIPEEARAALLETYSEAIVSMQTTDVNEK